MLVHIVATMCELTHRDINTEGFLEEVWNFSIENYFLKALIVTFEVKCQMTFQIIAPLTI